PVIENPVDPIFLAFEADFQVRRGPMIAAPFIEGEDRPFAVIIMDNGKIGTADQLFPGKTEKCLDTTVDEGKAARLVQSVDDVGRALDHEAVQPLRLLQSRRHQDTVSLELP